MKDDIKEACDDEDSTDSLNFTRAAEENNAENLLVIRDADLANRYTKNWREHLTHSAPYQGLGAQG
jgi:hypothetical protein